MVSNGVEGVRVFAVVPVLGPRGLQFVGKETSKGPVLPSHVVRFEYESTSDYCGDYDGSIFFASDAFRSAVNLLWFVLDRRRGTSVPDSFALPNRHTIREYANGYEASSEQCRFVVLPLTPDLEGGFGVYNPSSFITDDRLSGACSVGLYHYLRRMEAMVHRAQVSVSDVVIGEKLAPSAGFTEF